MVKPDDAFLTRLLATFKIEAQEHLEAMSSLLLGLEGTAAGERRQEFVETLFREAHSLKGAARAVNLAEIEAVCQVLEEVLAELKHGEGELPARLFDDLHQVVDGLGSLLAAATTGQPGVNHNLSAQLVQRLEHGRRGGAKEEVHRPTAAPLSLEPAAMASERQPAPAETVRVATTRLDSLLHQTEGLLASKLASTHLAAELGALNAAAVAWQREWARAVRDERVLRHELEKSVTENGLQESGKQGARIKRLLETLERNGTFLRSFEGRLTSLAVMAAQGHRFLGGTVDALLDGMRQTLMLPFSTLLSVFPKLVRDLSRDMGKPVNLVIRGAELEADRRILEELKDPLIHLVRNAIDHGIEDPETRAQQQKPPQGTIVVAISPKNASKVEILVSDDGAGIDIAQVLATAVRLGIVSLGEAEQMSEPESLPLILASGFSTSPIVTAISGRGLGLAIVREKVEKLGGTLAIETHPDTGTTFRLVLPLTLATFRGLLVQVGERLFVLPTIHVERVVRVTDEAIKTVENRETFLLEGRTVALARLHDVLGLLGSGTGRAAGGAPAVVLTLAATRLGFLVDEVLKEQEVLVKGLGPQLVRVRNLAGAAVLGTGQVVPVLNISDLMKSAVKAAASPAVAREPEEQRKTILVAEDSVTSRMLLKNILESAGYQVTTVVNGAEALTTLRTRPFDLVVTDVEMPQMDGFGLTARIRADKQLAALPVVLVTALGSREHRERGIDVGANAYVVKSSFDQSDLLEIIRRLL